VGRSGSGPTSVAGGSDRGGKLLQKGALMERAAQRGVALPRGRADEGRKLASLKWEHSSVAGALGWSGEVTGDRPERAQPAPVLGWQCACALMFLLAQRAAISCGASIFPAATGRGAAGHVSYDRARFGLRRLHWRVAACWRLLISFWPASFYSNQGFRMASYLCSYA
jgi:hypothetical protein